MYFLLGISLTLAFLLIVNMMVAMLASGFWWVISERFLRFSVATRAQLIFGLRVLPVAVSLVFVFAFLVPSYILHEPASSGEIVGGKLGLIAIVSTLCVLVAIFRVLKTWLDTRRLAAVWMKDADEVSFDIVDIPVYRFRHQFPVIAVMGIFRPRLFVAEQVLTSLSKAEFAAAVAHEYGHLRSKDNFKRTLLRVCRDLLILPFGRDLDLAWAENAEVVADEYAASQGPSTALDLASALVKIARIAPTNTFPLMPSCATLIGTPNSDITSRVRRLLSISENGSFAEFAILGHSPFSLLSSAALIALVALPLIDHRFLSSTHEVVERFVSFLQ